MIRQAGAVLSGFAVGFVLVLVVHACGATGPELEAFAKVQENSNRQIAEALAHVAASSKTPETAKAAAEARLVVDSAIRANALQTQATLSSLQERILSWWEVAATVAGGLLGLGVPALALQGRYRNKTRETKVAELVVAELARLRAAGLPPT